MGITWNAAAGCALHGAQQKQIERALNGSKDGNNNKKYLYLSASQGMARRPETGQKTVIELDPTINMFNISTLLLVSSYTSFSSFAHLISTRFFPFYSCIRFGLRNIVTHLNIVHF